MEILADRWGVGGQNFARRPTGIVLRKNCMDLIGPYLTLIGKVGGAQSGLKNLYVETL
jgi:hypothetical protein